MARTSALKPDEIVALEEVENASAKTTLSMKECVSKFSETSVGNEAVTVSSIHSIWEKIVGSDISQHANVRHIRNGILYISVDHPAWSNQLDFMKEKIITEVNLELNQEKIDSIHVSIKRV